MTTDTQQEIAPETSSVAGTDGDYEANFEAFAKGETPPEPEPTQELGKEEGEVPPVDKVVDPNTDQGNEDPPPVEAPDIWEGASDDQKAALEAAEKKATDLLHRINSDGGRVAAFQRKITDLETKLASKADAGNNEVEEDDKGMEGLREEYPEISGPIEKLIHGKDARISALEEKFVERDAVDAQANLDNQAKIFTDAHPDWEAQTGSVEFGQWLDEQPPYVYEAFQRNAANVVDGKEAVHLLDQFKATMAEPEPSSEVSTEEGKNSNIEGKRERQLKAGASAQGKGPGAGSGPPDNFEKAFDVYAKE